MQGLEVMDTYTSASCDQQLHWIKPSGPALPGQSHWHQRKGQQALQQAVVVKSAGRLTFACDIY